MLERVSRPGSPCDNCFALVTGPSNALPGLRMGNNNNCDFARDAAVALDPRVRVEGGYAHRSPPFTAAAAQLRQRTSAPRQTTPRR